MIFVILALAILVLFVLVVLYFFSLAFIRKNNANVDKMDSTIGESLKPFSGVMEKGMEFIKNTNHEWIYTTAFDGVKLAGRYYDNNSSCTIFLFHGYRSSGTRDFSCAVEMYYKMGFNIFLADQRAHGRSTGKLITFGVKESRDVATWVKLISDKYSAKQVVISGISMGATTVLLSLYHDLPKNVVGVIADCGFSSPAEIIEKVGRDAYKVNAHFFIPFLDTACKIIGKFSIRGVSTVEAVKKTNLPIMLIHGKKDNFVPCEMSEKTFEACNDNCRIFISEQAGHGMSFLTDTDDLVAELKSFLNFCIKEV